MAPPAYVFRSMTAADLRAFIARLFGDSVPRVVIDPRSDNPRAVRAYEKAGFERDRMVETPDGPALLMVRNP